jgi:DNA-binding response OmpR family regulator
LTAKNSEDDVINGLSLGADDYIAKPFSVRELLLRIESILRRSGRDRSQSSLDLGDIVVDLDNLNADFLGESIQFTRREVDVLLFLKHHEVRPVSRRELLNEVWGYNKRTEFDTRTVDIHIAKLRKKIEVDPKNPTRLVTVRGEGYKLLASTCR